jgi:hypothetical protein
MFIGFNTTSEIINIILTFASITYVFLYIFHIKEFIKWLGITQYRRERIDILESEIKSIKSEIENNTKKKGKI